MKIANAQIDSYIQRIAQEKIAGCLVFGPESSVVNFRFNLIAKKISPDLADPFLVTHISKERLSEDKAILADEFYSFPMLGGRKLIIIKDSDTSCSPALKMIFEDKEYHKKSENFILIQAGDLDKSTSLRKLCEENSHFAAIACYEDDERTIKKLIVDELVKKQVKSSPQVVEFLYEKLGKNRQIINLEIEKIALFLGDKKELTLDDANKINGSEGEESVDNFVINFVSGKFDIASNLAERLVNQGVEPILIIRFLSNYLQKLYQAKCEMEFSGLDFESAVKNQRLFFKTEIEFKKHLKTVSLNFLTQNLQRIFEIEAKIKTSSISPRLVFIDFVQNFKIF